MTDLHAELERAARLAAASPCCWFCGCALDAGAGPMATCADAAACGVRAVSPPPGSPPHHTPGTGACDPEEACCGECAGAYAEADGSEEDETV